MKGYNVSLISFIYLRLKMVVEKNDVIFPDFSCLHNIYIYKQEVIIDMEGALDPFSTL